MLSDVNRAYLYAKASRELYVELPHEDPCWSADEVGRLNLALYGTRDAATLWQECVADHLEGVGFRRGRSNPCVFFHKHRELRALAHGDDYTSVGDLDGLRWLQKQLEAKCEMSTVVVGHSGLEGEVTKWQILNRIIRAADEGWQYESDQRHFEFTIEETGLSTATPLGTAGADEKKYTGKAESNNDDDASPEL